MWPLLFKRAQLRSEAVIAIAKFGPLEPSFPGRHQVPTLLDFYYFVHINTIISALITDIT
jgi:hypothetical protein